MFIFSIVLMISLIGIANQAFAGIVIVGPEKTVTAYAGESKEIEVLVRNDGYSEKSFYFSVWPSYWVDLQKYWTTLSPGEVKEMKLIINPPMDAEQGTQVFTFLVKSLDGSISTSQEILVDVERKTDIFVSEVELNKGSFDPGETLEIETFITNVNSEKTLAASVTTRIKRGDLIVETFDDFVTVGPESIKKISHSFQIEATMVYGDYEVEITLRDNLNKILDVESINFRVKPVSNVVKEKDVKYSLLFNTITIKIANQGNIPESESYVTESISRISRVFFHPELEPISEERKDNRIVYTWSVVALEPGESFDIRYQFRFTSVVLASGGLILAAITGLWFFYRPRLLKSYMGLFSGKEEITISLHVRNKERRDIKNVLIKDFVPSLARVIRKFDTLTPKIKRRDIGTELKWKIRKLKRGEERILTYKIKPIIEIVGSLKLPKATFEYRTKEGKKRRVASKAMTVRGKVK